MIKKTSTALCGLMTGLLLLGFATSDSHAATITYDLDFSGGDDYHGWSATFEFDSADIAANAGGTVVATDYTITATVGLYLPGPAIWDLNDKALEPTLPPLTGIVNITGTDVIFISNGNTAMDNAAPGGPGGGGSGNQFALFWVNGVYNAIPLNSGGPSSYTMSRSAVPEPSSVFLSLVGLAAFGLRRRRK